MSVRVALLTACLILGACRGECDGHEVADGSYAVLDPESGDEIGTATVSDERIQVTYTDASGATWTVILDPDGAGS